MDRLKRIILTFSLALTSSLIAQITVSGTVTDASTGEALAGANVFVEGTNKGKIESIYVLENSLCPMSLRKYFEVK